MRQQLLTASDYWVATIRPNGHPHAAPIWGCFVNDDLFLETDPQTLKARNWARDPRAVVHIGGGSAVVIVEGRIHPHVPDEATGELVAAQMKGKYDGYSPEPHDWDGGFGRNAIDGADHELIDHQVTDDLHGSPAQAIEQLRLHDKTQTLIKRRGSRRPGRRAGADPQRREA